MSKAVLITAANNGIGLGLAKALSARGSLVAGLDLSTENLAGITSYVCDVTDPDRTRAVVDQIAAEWGRIGVLVNNACLAVYASFESKSIADTRREFGVN